jgi:HK97 family phage prohead protease
MKQQKGSQSPKRELRVTGTPQRFEIRKNADGSQTIAGYAVRFNSLSLDLGGFVEKIAPGAFTQSLKDHSDVQILYAHDDSKILGRVSSGTATVTQDDDGVQFTCKLPDTSTARDLIALMERNDLSQMSFGFSVVPNGDDWQDVDGQIIRTVNTAILYELSVVGNPAYTESSVSLRSCPVTLRSKIKAEDIDPDDDDDDDLDDPDDLDDEEDDEETRCDCDCPECVDGDCTDCSDPECDDPDCEGCSSPMQDDSRADKMRVRSLFAHRMIYKFKK